MPIFNQEIRTQLTYLIGELPSKVNLYLFVSKEKCRTCKDTQQYIYEFSELNTNIELKLIEKETEPELIQKYKIEHYPALLILDKDYIYNGIRFYGIPSGYEVHSLIASIKEASGLDEDIEPEILDRINKIKIPVHIQVFVTPTCPYCPAAVINGHKLSYLSEFVTCDMIEATSFPEISEKYGVRGVPKIVINETHDLTGSQPIEKFLDIIEKLN